MGYDKLLFREQNATYLAVWYQETRFALLSVMASRIFSRNLLIVRNQFSI